LGTLLIFAGIALVGSTHIRTNTSPLAEVKKQ
jgi:hypothetical protein